MNSLLVRLAVAWLMVGGVWAHAVSAADVASASSERARVVKFFKDNVVGKKLELKIVSKIDNGKVDTEFHRTTTFINFAETADGFVFDEVGLIQQANFDLDKDGKRILPGRTKDRTVVVHWEIGQRKSSQRLLGIGRVTINTHDQKTGSAQHIQASMVGDKLILTYADVLYADFYAAAGKFKPGASECRDELSVSGGKLVRVQKVTSYDVNPDTLQRTPSGSPETLVDKELQ